MFDFKNRWIKGTDSCNSRQNIYVKITALIMFNFPFHKLVAHVVPALPLYLFGVYAFMRHFRIAISSAPSKVVPFSFAFSHTPKFIASFKVFSHHRPDDFAVEWGYLRRHSLLHHRLGVWWRRSLSNAKLDPFLHRRQHCIYRHSKVLKIQVYN